MQRTRHVLVKYKLQPVHSLRCLTLISLNMTQACTTGESSHCSALSGRSNDRLVKLPVHSPQERLEDVLLAQDAIMDVKQGRVDAVTDPVFAIWLKTTAHEAGQGRDGPVFRFEVVVECAQVVRY